VPFSRTFSPASPSLAPLPFATMSVMVVTMSPPPAKSSSSSYSMPSSALSIADTWDRSTRMSPALFSLKSSPCS